MTKTDPGPLRSAHPEGRRTSVVVCVDDEPHILASLARLLRGEPYRLRTTTDPEEALNWIRSGDVRAVVADYRMPGMSGTTLLQSAKASSPRTRRILLTGYPGETMVIAAGEAGLVDLVGKPWQDETLKRMIRDRVEAAEREDGG